MSDLAANGIPITLTWRVLKLARQPYYRWLRSPLRAAEQHRAAGMNALIDAHAEDPEFGYRYLRDEAARAGTKMCRRTAWSLASAAGIVSAVQRPRVKGKKGRPGPPVFDDFVKRQFRADAPNRVWLSDITEHWTSTGKLYACAIKDGYSNRIVGYSMDSRMTFKLAVDSLNSAVARRGGEVAGCILHANRGSQFRSRKRGHTLARHRMVASMGKVASVRR